MTAPSLILLGNGSDDPRVAQVSHGIREGLLEIRPELDIQVAFVDHCPPSTFQVVNKLVKRGVEEVVFVPLLLSVAFHGPADLTRSWLRCAARIPDLRVGASRPDRPRGPVVVDHRSSAPRGASGRVGSASWTAWCSLRPAVRTFAATRSSLAAPASGRPTTSCRA